MSDDRSKNESDDDEAPIEPRDDDGTTIIRPGAEDESTLITPKTGEDATLIAAQGDGDSTTIIQPQEDRDATMPGTGGPGTTTADSHEALPASYIGPYEVVRIVGEGGMGKVYEAMDNSLDRKTAVKVVAAEKYPPAFRAELAKRQIQEAQLAARVSSPNLVGVFAAGQDGGQPYIAMEYVTGRALDGVLEKEGKVGLDYAIAYILQAAWGLHALHQKEIIHRDIKPANILVDDAGLVKVTDFGLALPIEGDEGAEGQGIIVGTIPYLPPEQLAAESVDARADIYSLGVTLFELLTGKKPFAAMSLAEIREELPNFDLDKALAAETELDPKIRDIIRTMMASNREDRYSDCVELMDALDDCRGALRLEDRRPVEARIGQTVVVQVVSKVIAAVLNVVIGISFFSFVSISGQDEGYGVLSSFWHVLRDTPYRYVPDYTAERTPALSIVTIPEWPIDIDRFEELVSKVNELEPAAIVLDILLDETSRLQNKESLADTFAEVENLIVATDVVDGREVPPIPALQETGLKTGVAIQSTDWDRVVRRSQLNFVTADGEAVPTLAHRAAEAYYAYHGLEMPEFPDEVLVHYGPMEQLLPMKDQTDRAMIGQIGAGFLTKEDAAGRIFLIGSGATVDDVHEYPLFGELANAPGMFLQGVLIDNLIHNQQVRPLSLLPLICGTIVLLGLAFALGTFWGPYWLLTNWCAMLGVYMGAGALLMTKAILIPGLPLVLLILLASTAGTGFHSWRKARKT